MKKIILCAGFLSLGLFICKLLVYNILIARRLNESDLNAMAAFLIVTGVIMGITLKIVIDDRRTAGGIREKIDSPLSKRELEVLNLMAMGESNREIASRLFISLNTVKSHSSNLYSKLQVNRRTRAIRKARKLGLIGTDDGI